MALSKPVKNFPIHTEMANDSMKPVASLLLLLNFCMYAVLLGIGGWAMNRAIGHRFIIGPGLELPAHFSPIFFPMGNAATGFFVTFSLIAGVVGAASCISGFIHLRAWSRESAPATATVATIAWTLTLLAMGLFAAFRAIVVSYLVKISSRARIVREPARLIYTGLHQWLQTITCTTSFRFACKEIELQYRSARLVALEAFSIILSVTQLLYVAALHGPST